MLALWVAVCSVCARCARVRGCVLGRVQGRVQGLVVAGRFWCSYAWVSLTQTPPARPRAACAPVCTPVCACGCVRVRVRVCTGVRSCRRCVRCVGAVVWCVLRCAALRGVLLAVCFWLGRVVLLTSFLLGALAVLASLYLLAVPSRCTFSLPLGIVLCIVLCRRCVRCVLAGTVCCGRRG